MNSIYETDPLSAGSTALALTCDSHPDAGHPGDFIANRGVERGEHLPQATTGTAITYGQQLFTRTHTQPDGIQFVSPNHLYQPILTAAFGMGKRLKEVLSSLEQARKEVAEGRPREAAGALTRGAEQYHTAALAVHGTARRARLAGTVDMARLAAELDRGE